LAEYGLIQRHDSRGDGFDCVIRTDVISERRTRRGPSCRLIHNTLHGRYQGSNIACGNEWREWFATRIWLEHVPHRANIRRDHRQAAGRCFEHRIRQSLAMTGMHKNISPRQPFGFHPRIGWPQPAHLIRDAQFSQPLLNQPALWIINRS
jgi:hypothetical protein